MEAPCTTMKVTHHTAIIDRPRSKRIQTRTKGKRKMKRLAREAAEHMRKLIRQTDWDIWAYTAMGKYP